MFVCSFTTNSGALSLISVLVPGMQAVSLHTGISELPFLGKSQAQSRVEAWISLGPELLLLFG